MARRWSSRSYACSSPLTFSLSLSLSLLLLLLLPLTLTTPSTAQTTPTTGTCATSIFDTLVPAYELTPDEATTRLTFQPGKHPSHVICTTFVGRDSCCTDSTLADFVRWSDAIDDFMGGAFYTQYLIETNPRVIIDQIIAFARVSIHSNPNRPINWVAVRNYVRDEGGDLLSRGSKAILPHVVDLWKAVVTYQEGLLCSSCEPSFSRFLDVPSKKLVVRPAAAMDAANALVQTLQAVDEFLKDEYIVAHLKHVLEQGCASAIGSMLKCSGVGLAVGLGLKILVGPQLRSIVCGVPANSPDPDQACRDFVLNKMLRGLYVDYAPILHNVVGWFAHICEKALGDKCSELSKLNSRIDEYFFTFDTRVVVSNVYVDNDSGYDVKAAACASQLSAYGCGGSGPEPRKHGGEVPDVGRGGLSPGAIAGIVIGVLAALGLAVAAFVWRQRLSGVVGAAYFRMRDGESGRVGGGGGDGSGPLVGMV